MIRLFKPFGLGMAAALMLAAPPVLAQMPGHAAESSASVAQPLPPSVYSLQVKPIDRPHPSPSYVATPDQADGEANETAPPQAPMNHQQHHGHGGHGQ